MLIGFSILIGITTTALYAEEIRIDTAEQWRMWTLPGDALSVGTDAISPSFVRRDINAVQNAPDFGGGIRAAGSALGQAERVIDGDPATAWLPSSETSVEDWWIEFDLGRAVSAREIVLTLAPEGPPLEFFRVFASNGEEFFNTSGTTIAGQIRYNDTWRYSFNEERLITINFGLKPLQFIRIQADRTTPGAGLAELAVESVGDNIALGLIDRGGAVSILNEIGGAKEGYESSGKSITLVDGDIKSNWTYKGASAPGDTEFEFDLGAVFWVDRVRLLGDLTGIPPSGVERARTRQLAINYSWYKLWASDGSLSPDGSLRWTLVGGLPESRRNWRDIVHFEERFPLEQIRYLRLRFGNQGCCLSGTTAEVQVFGEGHPAKLKATSPIYDLGGDKNITALSWQADLPPGTRLEIRSRSGNELIELYIFHDKNGKEITQRKYDKLIPSFKGRIDTLRSPGADWSTWSESYDAPNLPFLSPVPRRYLQLDASFFSTDRQRAVRLEEIALEFDEPLAAITRGEIYPVEVQPGEPAIFTYFIRPGFAPGNIGFDQLLLTSSAPIEFHELRIDGETATVSAHATNRGARIDLGQTIRHQGLLEIDFESTIFANQTRFDAFLLHANRGNGTLEVRQQVDPGNAATEIPSEAISVALPPEVPLLDELVLSSNFLTPNGDGLNDELQLSLNVLRLLSPRILRTEVLDLSGRLERLLTEAPITAGRFEISWDGRNQHGVLLAPGLYVLHIEVAGDAETARRARIIAVAY